MEKKPNSWTDSFPDYSAIKPTINENEPILRTIQEDKKRQELRESIKRARESIKQYEAQNKYFNQNLGDING